MKNFNAKKVILKNNSEVLLRVATELDAEKLNDLASEVFKSSDYLITTIQEFEGTTIEQAKTRIKKFLDNEGSILLVAEEAGRLVGMIDLTNSARNRIQHKATMAISIHPSFRNLGLGYQMLYSLIEWAKTHPLLELICLGVIEKNTTAIALYKKCGFEVTGREPFYVKHENGEYWADLSMSLMVKNL